MAAALDKRLDYLINDLKAYEGFSHAGRGRRHSVKRLLYRWSKAQEDMAIVKLHLLQRNLWKSARTGNRNEGLEEILNEDWRQFQLLPADGRHLRVEDKRKQLLAYRFQLPEKFTQTLANTENLIPVKPVQIHSHHATTNRHWGLWKGRISEPCMTADYARDLPFSQQWLDANRELFQYLSNNLRLLQPEMYVRYSSITRFLPAEVRPVCGAWYTCAINQNTTMDEVAHLDQNNYYCGLNVVVGWGDYKSAKLVLWDLKVVVEMLPGDAIFFPGSAITHSTVDVRGESRNTINCFADQNLLDWKDKKHKELTGYDRGEKSGERGKMKERGKKRKREKDEEMEAREGPGARGEVVAEYFKAELEIKELDTLS
ncbi:MAG: hypothetical protein M1840_000812 [Geoglossum simile]|nr:MAG: hypothetical protein M1840_000812 [Geoglossum simile]